MRKPDFYLCENKGADQLRSLSAPLYSLLGLYNSSSTQNFKILSSETVQAGLCQTRSDIRKTVFSHTMAHLVSLCFHDFLMLHNSKQDK